jgi:hypothetical protein
MKRPDDDDKPASTYFDLQRRPDSAPVLGSGVADCHQPPLRPGDREPVTYFELARRSKVDPGDTPAPGDTIPPQPSSSPWASDPVGPEPLIDRTEDADVMGVPIDQLP